MSNQNLLRYVTYCGLCAHHNCIPQKAKQLRKSLHEEGMDNWYQYIPEMKKHVPTILAIPPKISRLGLHM
jgi:hypothetical protein